MVYQVDMQIWHGGELHTISQRVISPADLPEAVTLDDVWMNEEYFNDDEWDEPDILAISLQAHAQSGLNAYDPGNEFDFLYVHKATILPLKGVDYLRASGYPAAHQPALELAS